MFKSVRWGFVLIALIGLLIAAFGGWGIIRGWGIHGTLSVTSAGNGCLTMEMIRCT